MPGSLSSIEQYSVPETSPSPAQSSGTLCLQNSAFRRRLLPRLPDASKLARSRASTSTSEDSTLRYITTTTTAPQPFYGPFFQDHPGEPVPENLWALWCKGRLTEADTPTIWLGATPSGLTSAHIHHPTYFLQAGCPSCRPTNSVKALKAITLRYINLLIIKRRKGGGSKYTSFTLPEAVRAGWVGQQDGQFARLTDEAYAEVERVGGEPQRGHDDGRLERHRLHRAVVELHVERQPEHQLPRTAVVRAHQLDAVRRRTLKELERVDVAEEIRGQAERHADGVALARREHPALGTVQTATGLACRRVQLDDAERRRTGQAVAEQRRRVVTQRQ